MLLAGPGLGLFAWQADRVATTSFGAEVIHGLGNVPSPWLALAFVTGVILRRWYVGAAGGAFVLCLAVAAYYLAITMSGDRAGIPLRGALTGWLAVALIAGPVFGMAGAVWRSGPAVLRPFAVGLLAGGLIGEVAFFSADALRYGLWQWGDTRIALASADIFVALSLPLLLLQRPSQQIPAYITAAMMGSMALIAMVLVDQLMYDLFNA